MCVIRMYNEYELCDIYEKWSERYKSDWCGTNMCAECSAESAMHHVLVWMYVDESARDWPVAYKCSTRFCAVFVFGWLLNGFLPDECNWVRVGKACEGGERPYNCPCGRFYWWPVQRSCEWGGLWLMACADRSVCVCVVCVMCVCARARVRCE